MVRYIAAILDYIAADILKLAGNVMKNTQSVAIRIKVSDIKLSLNADVALHSLFKQLNAQQLGDGTLPPVEACEENEQAATYDQLVRQLVSNEEKYISHLNLILKVYQEPFTDKPKLFPPEEVKKVFLHLPELHALSVQLLSSLDECMEMAGVVDGEPQSPQAGFVFEEMAESQEFDVYTNYASSYSDSVNALEKLLENAEAKEYLKTLTEPDLFKEAIQYVLPKSLLEPLYHCFYYFEAVNMLMRKSKGGDLDAYEAAEGCMVRLKMNLEKQCTGLLPSRKEDLGVLVQKPSYKTSMKIISSVQSKIEGWEGPDLLQCSTEFLMEGSVVITREGNRRRIDRHVFLLDGLAVCCKPRQGNQEMYRFKEKINLRRVKLKDMQDDEESTDMKYSLLLIEPEQQPYTFFFQNKSEKIEWMSALTHMLTKSTFDRKLDMKLKDEEQDIPQLRPHPAYRFTEEDSGSNILFDEREEGKFKSSNEALIKACTIHKLIERLTYHEYAG
jgi:son of sevenless-like protein